ncbi:MAG: hypothetical protein JXR37_04445 [Kiritimatiellae bacterium]|nr:hypothetical protein [Kiritimatiellia bacterium]
MQEEAPTWNPASPAESLRAYARWARDMAVIHFLGDQTHVELFFFLQKDGEGSLAPAPPGVPRDDLNATVRRKVKDEQIYGVIHIAEAWMYFPRGKDHTALQIRSGEIAVADLKGDDRKEALIVTMESRDGDYSAWLAPIVRDPAGNATLGHGRDVSGQPGPGLPRFFG